MQAFFSLLLVISSTLILGCSTVRSECGGRTIKHVFRVSQNPIKPPYFKTVQEAINAIPSNNRRWVIIQISPGIYKEKVNIPYDKQCIILKGKDAKNTIITYDDYGLEDTSNATFTSSAEVRDASSATFTSSADNFRAIGIGFENSAGLSERKILGRGLAITIYGDKSLLHNCRFVGMQDTIWDAEGRHYFKSCYIEGAVDFIWGNGQSVYEDCSIRVNGGGFITAQARETPSSTSGFVFLRGSVSGNARTYLGRAYREYSRVIYMGTHFANIIQPRGWDAWNYKKDKVNIMYAEVNCTGPGANLAQRVRWSKKELSPRELKQYTVRAFINQDGWI